MNRELMESIWAKRLRAEEKHRTIMAIVSGLSGDRKNDTVKINRPPEYVFDRQYAIYSDMKMSRT